MSNKPSVDNPYASPVSSSTVVGSSDDEVVRNRYLNHEASVKSIAHLNLLSGAIVMFLGIFYIAMGISGPGSTEMEHFRAFFIGLGIVCFLFSMLQLYAAITLRKLENVGRIIVTVFSVIGFPIGTLISGYILYLLWSAKGNFIFTPEYQRVIQATPNIKYKTSIVIWILLGLVLLLIAMAIAGAFLSIDA